MSTRRGNLFAASQPPARGERFEALHERNGLRVERIVSSSEVEPTDYDQAHDEWVALLRGEATLDVQGETVRLGAGDWLFLPARTRHRVVQVSGNPLWLAVHDRESNPG